MNKTRQAFLLLSHLSTDTIIKAFENIRRSTKHSGDAFFLYDATRNIIPDKINKLHPYLYSEESLSRLPYPTIGQDILPGHAHFPVFQFFRDNPDYDYYWVLEYDVKFSGEWRLFFDSFLKTDADFLTCHIRPYADERDWPWWELNHPQEAIPLNERLRSFNPIYRISKAALLFLHQAFKSGWRGHYEVALPTLLHKNGLSIRDISGSGKYTIPGMDNLFYSSSESSSGGTLTSGTFRYRPAFWRYGREKNKLYHPVKPLKTTLYDNLLYHKETWARRLTLANILRKTTGLFADVRNRYSDISHITNQFFIKYIFKKDQPLTKPKVGIVITSYNHIDYTARALESFYSTINNKIDHELWLMDDNSSEDIENIYNKYKKHGLKFFKNKTNAGLTSLWNKAFELNKDKDYLIICNNDVIFSNHWADNLIDALRNSIYFSVAVPVTNAPGHISAQHISNFVKNYIPTDNQNEINLISEEIKDPTPLKIKKGNGFCLAIKVSLLSRKLIEGVPFNNKFPLYGGEDEFFSRVKPRTMIVPDSFVFHYKHISVASNYFPEQEYR